MGTVGWILVYLDLMTDYWGLFFGLSMVVFGFVGVGMFCIWWRTFQAIVGRPNIILSIVAWGFYIVGWSASVLALTRKLPTFGDGTWVAYGVLVVLAPPVYISARTVLVFLTGVEKRVRLLPLAALSNRSVPLGMNSHLVGPVPETWDSHRMLVMLNVYAVLGTLAAKIVAFLVDPDLMVDYPLFLLLHISHLFATSWAALYSIRLRQNAMDRYALDKWRAADSRVVAPSDVDASAEVKKSK